MIVACRDRGFANETVIAHVICLVVFDSFAFVGAQEIFEDLDMLSHCTRALIYLARHLHDYS